MLRYAFFSSVVSTSAAFGIYFVIAGSVFLGIYRVPHYQYEDWHLLAGVALGLLAAVTVVLTLAVHSLAEKLLSHVKIPDILLPMLGGLAFGAIGVMLPLTNFTGSDQLGTALQNAGALGIGLLLATLFGKMVTFAVSSASGFIGGPIFPILFIGGIAGIIVNQLFPEVPLGLSFTCRCWRRCPAPSSPPVHDGAPRHAAHAGGRPADRSGPHRRGDRVSHHRRHPFRHGRPEEVVNDRQSTVPMRGLTGEGEAVPPPQIRVRRDESTARAVPTSLPAVCRIRCQRRLPEASRRAGDRPTSA